MGKDKTDLRMDCLKSWGCPTSKTKIWSYLSNDNSTEIYENFYEVLNFLLAEEDDTEDIIRYIYQTNLESSQTFKACIITMFRKSYQDESSQDITEDLYFLTKVFPTYLEGKDTHLLFENLWEILKEIGFNEDQICSAWGLSLCPILDPSFWRW